MGRPIRLLAVPILLAAAVLARGAYAGWRFYEDGGFALDAGFTAGTGLFSSPSAQFGAGTYTQNNNQLIAKNPVWFEGYVAPNLKASFISSGAGEFFGDVSAVGAMTRGDGDANLNSLTFGNPQHIAVENAFVGWRSGDVLGDLPSNALDIRVGRQPFQVGDAFLIGDGTFDAGRRAAYILNPRLAFDGLGVAQVNTDPVRGDLFLLRSTTDQTLLTGLDQPRTDFFGGNVEWFESKQDGQGRSAYIDRARYVGLMAMYAYDADNAGCFSFVNCLLGPSEISASADRKGLGVIAARLGGNMIPALPDFTLYGEYAYEYNSRGGDRVRANAWYAEPGWSFSSVAWAPRVYYRYSHFSGDSNPNDGTKQSFDPLFYTSGRGYGTWTMGEIAGQYFLFNSNQNTHQLGVSANPAADLTLSAIYYRFSYDQPGQFGGTASHAMDELDFVAQWAITGQLSLAGVVGVAWSGKGARQFLQDATSGFNNPPTSFNRPWTVTEVTLTYAF
ncbi:MAG: alginate export family protein [Alphaproteobacteria bacterium]